jgi:glutaredoxin
MKPILLTVIAVSLSLGAAAHAAKLYKWVDKDGNVTYQSTPPPGQAVEQKEIETVNTRTAGDSAAHAPVVLYVASHCSACDLARAYLDKRKVPYTLKNAESDPAVQEELKSKSGGLSVPTITIGDKVMRGYLESLLEGELDAAGYPKADAGTPAPNAEAPDQERGSQAPTE